MTTESGDGPVCRYDPALVSDVPPRRGGLGRRGFIGMLGSTGLAAAYALFGHTSVAGADGTCACCSLVFCPPTTSLTSCKAGSHYVWNCSQGAESCECCEVWNQAHTSYIASAYGCSC